MEEPTTWISTEDLQELARQKRELLDRYTPLLEKARRQLKRAEVLFLEADDSQPDSITEHAAIQRLDHAQSVCQFLTQMTWGIESSEVLDDLQYYRYD